MSNAQSNIAHLHLEKPLVAEKMTIAVPAGKNLRDILADVKIEAGFAFVVVVNGVVSESNIIIQAGDEIHCLPQITGGAQ